jgi:methylated-DNA-protein-cysteine methyltransferase-like protein
MSEQAKRRQRIRDTIREIPAGTVASYGQIAEIAGVPRGARQVGYTLRNLPADHDLPWHRVLKSSGEIAFAKGTPQFAEQRRRLTAEGVLVRAGKVNMRRCRWEPDIDELLWKPAFSWREE